MSNSSLSIDPRIIPLVRSLKEQNEKSGDILSKKNPQDISSEKTSENSTKHNLNKLEIKPIYSDDAYNHTYKIAMSIHRPDLFEQINKGLEHLIQTGEINKIHQKWFSSDYCKQ